MDYEKDELTELEGLDNQACDLQETEDCPRCPNKCWEFICEVIIPWVLAVSFNALVFQVQQAVTNFPIPDPPEQNMNIVK